MSIIAAGALAPAMGACDAGVEERARAAIQRQDRVATLKPVEAIINGHADEMTRISQAYETALKEAGYAEALAEAALTSSDEFARGPERITAARAAVAEHRTMALARTDAAMQALGALKAEHPGQAALIDAMLAELVLMRQRREAHWGHAQGIIDETLGAWRTLDEAEGDWGLESDGLKFTRMRDRDAYDAHGAKINAHITRQQRIMAEQAQSASRLLDLARGKGA